MTFAHKKGDFPLCGAVGGEGSGFFEQKLCGAGPCAANTKRRAEREIAIISKERRER